MMRNHILVIAGSPHLIIHSRYRCLHNMHTQDKAGNILAWSRRGLSPDPTTNEDLGTVRDFFLGGG